MKNSVNIAVICVVLQMLFSCRAISSFLREDEIVAEVGREKLYRSELDVLIPRGTSSEDSTRLALQYINTWAMDQVFQNIAEEQLSKSERDVTKELEDYRKSLLKYRYEQLYVNERLDTAVTEEMIQEYYDAHQDKFVLSRPLLKARYLCIASDSPSLAPIRKKMSSSDVGDLFEADSLAYSSALKFTTWGGQWIDVAVLAREFGADHGAIVSSMKNGWVERTDTAGQKKLAFISDMLIPGKIAPVEYVRENIRDMIISVRKQALITGLERELLDDARENGQFVIF